RDQFLLRNPPLHSRYRVQVQWPSQRRNGLRPRKPPHTFGSKFVRFCSGQDRGKLKRTRSPAPSGTFGGSVLLIWMLCWSGHPCPARKGHNEKTSPTAVWKHSFRQANQDVEFFVVGERQTAIKGNRYRTPVPYQNDCLACSKGAKANAREHHRHDQQQYTKRTSLG